MLAPIPRCTFLSEQLPVVCLGSLSYPVFTKILLLTLLVRKLKLRNNGKTLF